MIIWPCHVFVFNTIIFLLQKINWLWFSFSSKVFFSSIVCVPLSCLSVFTYGGGSEQTLCSYDQTKDALSFQIILGSCWTVSTVPTDHSFQVCMCDAARRCDLHKTVTIKKGKKQWVIDSIMRWRKHPQKTWKRGTNILHI